MSNFGLTEYNLDAVTVQTGFPIGDSLGEINFTYDYSALQIGASLPISFGAGLVTLNGTAALPSVGNGVETFIRVSTGQISHRREWEADTFSSNLEAQASYPIYGGFAAVGGFRWTSVHTSYKNWTNPLNPFRYAEGDTGDAIVNTYLPYIGVSTEMGGFRAGAVGFPFVFGEIQSKWNDEPLDLFRFSGNFDRGRVRGGFPTV